MICYIGPVTKKASYLYIKNIWPFGCLMPKLKEIAKVWRNGEKQRTREPEKKIREIE